MTLSELLNAAFFVRDSVYGESHAFASGADAVSYAVSVGLLDADGARNAVLLGRLFVFDDALSPAAESIEVYTAAKSSFADAGDLF